MLSSGSIVATHSRGCFLQFRLATVIFPFLQKSSIPTRGIRAACRCYVFDLCRTYLDAIQQILQSCVFDLHKGREDVSRDFKDAAKISWQREPIYSDYQENGHGAGAEYFPPIAPSQGLAHGEHGVRQHKGACVYMCWMLSTLSSSQHPT